MARRPAGRPVRSKMTPRAAGPAVRLVCWDAEGAAERVKELRKAGFRAAWDRGRAGDLRELSAEPPAAVVIDLSRLPSHGREVALALRQTKGTRHVPLVFVEGGPEKVDAMRDLLPDAAFTSWATVAGVLRHAIARARAGPVVPALPRAGYSGTPLPKKLGIKPGTVVALLNAPDGFMTTLGDVPEGVTFRDSLAGGADLTVLFVGSAAELRRAVPGARRAMGKGGLWIAWPKKASGLAPDLSEGLVREAGLGAGVVDVKVCAIDHTWSGLKFLERRKP